MVLPLLFICQHPKIMRYKNVLLTDDDLDDQQLFISAASAIDTSVHCWTNSDCYTAIAALETYTSLPDIIFIDLNIPVLHGFECLKIFKNSKRWKEIPVIIYSTSGFCTDIEKAKEYGAAAYVKKPDDFETLCSRVNAILKSKLNTGSEFITFL